MTYISFKNVKKVYKVSGEVKVTAIQDVSFEINVGEFVVILGSSGAGKTTLLNLLGGMEGAKKPKRDIDAYHARVE